MSLRGETGRDRRSSSEPFVWIRRSREIRRREEKTPESVYMRPHARAVSGSCRGKHQKSRKQMLSL